MLSPTEDQQILRDSVQRFARDAQSLGIGARRDVPQDLWRTMGEMGWFALSFAESDGGLGGSTADVCALVMELGRGLLVGSFVTNPLSAGRLLALSPAGSLRAGLIQKLMSGSRDLAVATRQAAAQSKGSGRALLASRTTEGWRLAGIRTNVWIDADTRSLLVSATTTADAEELLAVVPLSAPGLNVREMLTVDAGRALECRFDDVILPASAVLALPGPAARAARQAADDFAATVVGAECVGMMRSLLERTAEYLRTRKQFGKPLAAFQVLRHRMADMALVTRRAEVLNDRVARRFEHLESQERSRLVAAACVKGLSGLRMVAEQAIQLHGGMGMTAEMPVGAYLRRSIALEATFGTSQHHRTRFQELSA
jgi:alkylation response protein AidB-like acyl-CoA dehydrogenase